MSDTDSREDRSREDRSRDSRDQSQRDRERARQAQAQAQAQAQRRKGAPKFTGAGKLAALILFSLETLWTFLSIWQVTTPTEASPEWWRSDTNFLFLPTWIWVSLLLAVVLQFVFTYVPRFVPRNTPYSGTRGLLIFLNRAANFYGLYVLLALLGMVSNLEALRVHIVENVEIYDLVALAGVVGVGWLTSAIADMVLDSTN